MPTRLVRTGVRFSLQVTLTGAQPGVPPTSEEIRQVLAAVWAWVCFGGLGARTRRGFGALEIAEPVRLDAAEGIDVAAWGRLFQGPREPDGVQAWLGDFERVASPRGRAWPFRILVGSRKSQAAPAHEDIVHLLKCFRQEPNVGRNPGQPRPGQSRWPEPHLLRALTPCSGPHFEHAPPPETAEQVKRGEIGAPRAAFGLPIQVQFYFQHRGDQRANATLVPPGAQRWPSPLLVRPLRIASGGYCPAAVFLPIPPPDEVEVAFSAQPEPKRKVSVARFAGARNTIEKFLKPKRGRALEAFADWLTQEKGYRR